MCAAWLCVSVALLHNPLPYQDCTAFHCRAQVSCVLWIFGEYSSTREEVEAALDVIHSSIGPLPLLVVETGEHRGLCYAVRCCLKKGLVLAQQ